MDKKEFADQLKSAHYVSGECYSQQVYNTIVKYNLCGEAMDIAVEYNSPIAFRAAWGIEYLFFANRDVFTTHIPRFFRDFHNICNESVKRHYGKIMYTLLVVERHPVTLREVEQIAETVCRWMTDPKAKVANKVWCLDILAFLAQRVEWIKETLSDLIETEMIAPTPGIQCRIKKIRQRITL